MQDLGFTGSTPAGVSAIRYQTPPNLLIGRSSFANYERVTDSSVSDSIATAGSAHSRPGRKAEAFFQAAGFPFA